MDRLVCSAVFSGCLGTGQRGKKSGTGKRKIARLPGVKIQAVPGDCRTDEVVGMDRENQKRAPICEALERFRRQRVVPFDVPGT